MTIDPARFRAAIQSVHPGKLTRNDAETIVEISQLAVDADGREDPEEIQTFFGLGKAIYELAGLTETPSPSFDTDEDEGERLRSLAGKLSNPAAKELAYAVAYLMTISDVELAPAESEMVENLRDALGLGDERAAELAEKIASAITPPA